MISDSDNPPDESTNAHRPRSIADISDHYRSGERSLGSSFFQPCLKHCIAYRRASGYFSSHVLCDWISILEELVRGKDIEIKLVASPNLSKDDINTIRNVTDPSKKEALLSRLSDNVILGAIQALKSGAGSQSRLDLFSWLMAKDSLQIRFAFPNHIDSASIFHEKIGIFYFPWGDQIAFTGSANETSSGHYHNYESVDVYRSWVDHERSRVETKVQQFSEAWDGVAQGLTVLPPSQRVLDLINEIAPRDYPLQGRNLHFVAPSNQWRHQDQAKDAFLKVRAGVLEMATGTGKTRTAIKITEELFSRGSVNSLIICTVGTDLLNQWSNEFFTRLSHLKLNVLRHYERFHELGNYLSHPASSALVISRQALPKLLNVLPNDVRSKIFIIHDEVHGLGSEGSIRALSGQHASFQYRLGLSATPERDYDEVGTDFIKEEIGPVFFQFHLEDAIRRGILCEFDYVPITYPLTEDDKHRLNKVRQIEAARRHSGDPMPKSELYQKLSDVYKTAEMKPYKFRDYINNQPYVVKSCIIFVHTMEYGSLLYDTIHSCTSSYSTYYSDDDVETLKDFSRGELDCLITCHRLSQGIDIQHLQRVILLSSDKAKLETIQRIGRCLRTDPNNPTKRALVIDFIRESEPGRASENSDTIRRDWLSTISNVTREE